MTIDDMMAMGKYIYYSGDSNDLAVRTNFNSTFPSVPALMAKANPYNSSNNYVVIAWTPPTRPWTTMPMRIPSTTVPGRPS